MESTQLALLFPPLISGSAPETAQTEETHPAQVQSMWEAGFLLTIEIHYWTGQKILRPEDLGLQPHTLPELYSLGRKLLVPRETIARFRHLEDRARYVIERNSFAFPIGGLRFVPVTAADRLFAALDQVIAEFNAAVEQFVSEYGRVWEEMEPRYREAALLAYRISRSADPENEFVERFLQRVRGAYPDAAALRGKFAMRYHVFEIRSPTITRIASPHLAAEVSAYVRETLRTRIEEFVDQAAAELRTRVAEACERVVDMIRSGEVVREQTLSSLRHMVEDFRALNFVGDREVERRLVDLEQRYLRRSARELRDAPAALDGLRQALDTVARTTERDVSSVTGWLKRRILL